MKKMCAALNTSGFLLLVTFNNIMGRHTHCHLIRNYAEPVRSTTRLLIYFKCKLILTINT